LRLSAVVLIDKHFINIDKYAIIRQMLQATREAPQSLVQPLTLAERDIYAKLFAIDYNPCIQFGTISVVVQNGQAIVVSSEKSVRKNEI
jgi:hypothetical protein